MGLDIVEYVIRIEEEFEIAIPNEEAEKMINQRMVIDYLMSLPEINKKWSRDYVANKVWLILEDETRRKREDFDEDSRFVEDMGLD